tara:strand:- start:799 stop:972 length:174 start_codon:yes stop_codon:yes gene_type:complete
MTTLFYRGHDYVQHKKLSTDKNCIELTYRRNHYNNCRDQATVQVNGHLAYRGVSYSK